MTRRNVADSRAISSRRPSEGLACAFEQQVGDPAKRRWHDDQRSGVFRDERRGLRDLFGGGERCAAELPDFERLAAAGREAARAMLSASHRGLQAVERPAHLVVVVGQFHRRIRVPRGDAAQRVRVIARS
jgi:hypothetical protein